MAGSIIVAVRQGLVDALAPVINGTAGMADVHVDFQHPIGDESPRECVWTQNAQLDLRSASLRSGRNFLNETSTFDVIVRSWAPNRTAADSAQRVVDIAEVVTAWIGDHKNNELGIPGLQTLEVSGNGTQAESIVNDSVAGHMQVPVRFTARLT